MMMRTTDGGETWTQKVVSSQTDNNLNDVDFLDSNIGVAVGDGGTILQTADGGETWTKATELDLPGTTCQGAVGHDPRAAPGQLPLSAPSWPNAGLGGRRNVSLWTFEGSTFPANTEPESATTVWGGAGGYSSFDTTGGEVQLLFEAGNHVYNWGIKIARIA